MLSLLLQVDGIISLQYYLLDSAWMINTE